MTELPNKLEIDQNSEANEDKEKLISELLQKNIEGLGSECSGSLCGTPDQSGGGCGCGCGSILVAM